MTLLGAAVRAEECARAQVAASLAQILPHLELHAGAWVVRWGKKVAFSKLNETTHSIN